LNQFLTNFCYVYIYIQKMYQEVVLTKTKDGDETTHKLYYKDNTKNEEFSLNEDSYKQIFEDINPNRSLSTPDKMIQKFLPNTNTLPSLLDNRLFTNKEFDQSLKHIKDEMKYLVEMTKNIQKIKNKKSKSNYLRKVTRKKPVLNMKKRMLKKLIKPKKNSSVNKTKKKNPLKKAKQRQIKKNKSNQKK